MVNIQDGNNTVKKLAKVLGYSTAVLTAKLGLLEIEGLVAIKDEKIRLLK